MSNLIKLGWDVVLLVEVFGADLSDVHVNHVGVVPIYLHHLVFVVPINVDVVVRADVLVRQDHLGLPVLVTWGVHVPQL